MSVDDPSGPEARLLPWLDMWRDGSVHASDVVAVLRQCLAETGDPSCFLASPAEIQAGLLRGLRRFRKTGRLDIVIARTDHAKDLSGEARAAIATLIRAGVLGEDSAQIAQPRALFNGADHVLGGERLVDLTGTDPLLVSARLVALGLQPSGPFDTSQASTLSLQIDRHRRELTEGGFHHEVPTHSSVAHFAFHRPAPFYFSPCFRLDTLVSFNIEPVKLGRRQGFKVDLDFGAFEGDFTCHQVSLERVDALDVSPPG